MNRAERRRAKRQRFGHAWSAHVANEFGQAVADFVQYFTSMWEWTTFGVCSECGREVLPVSVAKQEFSDTEEETALTLRFTYWCGHDVIVGGGASPGFMAGLVEMIREAEGEVA